MAVHDVNDSHLITNTIRVTGMDHPVSGRIVAEGLRKLAGVVDVEATPRMNRVTVTYDLLRIQAQEIETALVGFGYPLDDSRPARMLRELQHYFEENEADSVGLAENNSYTKLSELHGQI